MPRVGGVAERRRSSREAEPDAAQDGRIVTFPLHAFYKTQTLLPVSLLQKIFIFTGTLRKNLDPYGRCNDEEIWKAIDLVSPFCTWAVQE